jgi:hypothetical protein
MRHFVVRVIPEKLIAPDRHVSWSVTGQVRLAVDDAKDLQLGKLTAASLGNPGEIRHWDSQERRDRAGPTGICTVAGGAGHLIYALAVCSLLAWSLARRTRG